MIERPNIPRASSALIMNDMINANLRGSDSSRNSGIEDSGIIKNTQRLVSRLRPNGIPVFWVRVERRPDQADVVDVLTDAFLASGRKRAAPIVKGSYEAANVDELPIEPEDQVIIKPRFNPFIGTDLDLLLRARRVDTLLMGGYSTNIGVESCVRTARDLGYNVVVLSDCCFNVDRELHEWSLGKIMPLFARVMTSQEAVELLVPLS